VRDDVQQELRAALYGMAGAPRVHGLLAGDPQPESLWVR
jgi:hypothetical protein